MATGRGGRGAAGGGASQFSPFNLFLKASKDWPMIKGDRAKAMETWNSLGEEEKRDFHFRSERIKEELKIASYQAEELQLKKHPMSSLQTLKDVFGGGSLDHEALFRRLRLVCVQYSAHAQVCGESRYYPNEISVLSFSLSEGVQIENTFFVQIPVDDIPAYCKAEMKERYNEHFIPYEEELIRFMGLAPIARTAEEALRHMFPDEREETLTFCIGADRHILSSSVKTLLSYVSRGKLSGFEEAMKRVIDFEDLLRLLLPSENRGGAAGAGGLSDLQKWKGELKDNLQEDIQFSVQCRCHFHRELEETLVNCAQLQAHSALHNLFRLLAKRSKVEELDFDIGQHHVKSIKDNRCSASFFAILSSLRESHVDGDDAAVAAPLPHLAETENDAKPCLTGREVTSPTPLAPLPPLPILTLHAKHFGKLMALVYSDCLDAELFGDYWEDSSRFNFPLNPSATAAAADTTAIRGLENLSIGPTYSPSVHSPSLHFPSSESTHTTVYPTIPPPPELPAHLCGINRASAVASSAASDAEWSPPRAPPSRYGPRPSTVREDDPVNPRYSSASSAYGPSSSTLLDNPLKPRYSSAVRLPGASLKRPYDVGRGRGFKRYDA